MASSSSNSNSHSGWTSSDDEDEADVMDHDLGSSYFLYLHPFAFLLFKKKKLKLNWWYDEGSDDEGGKSARSFREKRKAHYDEYRKVKELQKKESMKKDDEKQSIVDGVGDINISMHYKR